MRTLVVLAATIVCACAQVSMPPDYKEKYPNTYKYTKVARHPRDLTPKHLKDYFGSSTENQKQPLATTNGILPDKNLKENEGMLQHPKDITSQKVNIKVTNPNIATDHPKLGEVTTEHVELTTDSDTNMVIIKPTTDPKINDDDVTDYVLIAEVLISEEES